MSDLSAAERANRVWRESHDRPCVGAAEHREWERLWERELAADRLAVARACLAACEAEVARLSLSRG